MKDLTVFNFEGLSLEVFEKDEKTWFLANSLVVFLDYKNPSEAIRTNVDSDDLARIYVPSKSNTYVCVNESGLYSLILRSSKPEAKRFKKWVTSEVLPSIRKTGSYSIASKVEEKKTAGAALEAELNLNKLFDVPLHLAQIEAVKTVNAETGIDFTYLLKHAPAQQNIKDEEVMLEPTELGKIYNVSARKVNCILAECGYQYKDGDNWVTTSKADGIVSRHSWKKGTKTGYNFKWKQSAVNDSFLKSLTA